MTAKILYLVSEPWYFVNHRLDHARALRGAGFEVAVATRHGDREHEITEAGLEFQPFEMGRGIGGITGLARELWALRRLVKAVEPDVVHAVALKPVLLSIPLLFARHRPALVLSVNGLGISAVDGSRSLSLLRRVLRFVGHRRRVELLFQTKSDQAAVTGAESNGVVIPGVGVDLDSFRPSPEPQRPPLRICYLGRAVRSKGLTDLAEAAALDIVANTDIEIHAYCSLDDSSPGALTADELALIAECPNIMVHPPTSDPASVLARSHGAILPSRAGEGVSKFVLEALATATPLLLSEESGSAEVIDPGVTALTFAAGDPQSIASALVEFASMSDDGRRALGDAGRLLAEQHYSTDVILPQIIDLHRRLTESTPDDSL